MTDATLRRIATVVCKAADEDLAEISDWDDERPVTVVDRRPFHGMGIAELLVALRVEALERKMYDVAAELGGP